MVVDRALTLVAAVVAVKVGDEQAERLGTKRGRGRGGGCDNGEGWRGQRSGAVRESEGEGEGKSEEVDRIGTAPATSPSASRWQGRG